MDQNELEKLLKTLLELPHETEWVEFKANNSNPEEIGEYISALSNSICFLKRNKAYLVYGIEDNSLQVIGTNFKPRQKKIGNEELENWLLKLLNPKINFCIYEFQFQGKNIVLFEIFPTFNQPVSFKNEEYIRVGSYKKKLKDYPEKERSIWLSMESNSFERRIAKENLSDDEVLQHLDYSNFFKLLGLKVPTNKSGIIDALIKEKFINRNNSDFDITNLGAILFGENLNDFSNLSRKAIRVIIYKGINKLKTVKEQEGGKGYAIGFDLLVNYINDQLPVNEVIGQAFRKEIKMYPEIAIRELVANMLIHQDFFETGTGPMVEIFSDRIEISNPGKPLIAIDRFIDHSPQSRNEHLAKFMRRINICEERGSGIDKVISSIEVFQLPSPNFLVEDNYIKVILFSHKTLRQMSKNDKIRACYQHACLKHTVNDYMTNESIRERFNIDKKNYSTASRIISESLSTGIIKILDPLNESKKNIKYIPYWA